VLPLATPLECTELTQQDIELANGKHVANVRGEIIPYIRLREYFQMPIEQPEREQILIAETEVGTLRLRGRPGARRSPDGDQESRPLSTATSIWYRERRFSATARWP
jgi:hypothetical protein